MSRAQKALPEPQAAPPDGSAPPLRQTAILDTKQLLAYIRPISHHTYWKIIAKDPRFPKPLLGGNGAKALHSREAVDRYLQEVGRTGFILPTAGPADNDE